MKQLMHEADHSALFSADLLHEADHSALFSADLQISAVVTVLPLYVLMVYTGTTSTFTIILEE